MLPTNRCMPGRSKLLKVLGEFFFFFLLLSGTEDLESFFLHMRKDYANTQNNRILPFL